MSVAPIQPTPCPGTSCCGRCWLTAWGRTVISPHAVPALVSEELRQGPGSVGPLASTWNVLMCSALAWGVGLMGPHAAPALASQFPPSNGRGLIDHIEPV
jgi:hypothetical protein